MPEYPAVLAWLPLLVRSKRVQICVLLFPHKDETTMHAPSPTICSNPRATATFNAGTQQLLAVRMETSTVEGDTEQYIQADLVSCIVCVPMHVPKAFNFQM